MNLASITSINFQKWISGIPFMLVAVLYLIFADTKQWNVGDNYYGYFFVSMVIVFMFIETLIPNNLEPGWFLADIVFAVLALVLITWFLTSIHFNPEKEITFYHWLAFAMVIADSIINQYKNYRRIAN